MSWPVASKRVLSSRRSASSVVPTRITVCAGGKNMNGQLRELRVHTGDGTPTRILDLINAARSARGLSATPRADLRFSVNTPGRVYLINKQDGIIRRLVPDEPLRFSSSPTAENAVQIDFNGILQSSKDMEHWSDVRPQPTSPFTFAATPTPTFFRNVRR